VAEVGGAFAEPEPADAGANGPGRDQGHLLARLADALDAVRQRLDAALVQGAIGAGQYVGADLDDDGVGLGNDFLTNRIDHAWFQPACAGSGGTLVTGCFRFIVGRSEKSRSIPVASRNVCVTNGEVTFDRGNKCLYTRCL